jgi:hypothetical protein
MFRWVCLVAVCALPGLSTPLCVTTTLDNYIALGAGGCQLDTFTLTNFSYSFVSGTVSIPDSDITVTPSTASDMVGLTFSSPDFSVSGSDSAVYLLGYTYDPGDIRSLEDILNATTPVFPGFAQVTTEDCENSAFSGMTCPNTTDTITVSDNGITLNSPATVSFASPFIQTLGVLDTIELDANGASSQISGFGSQLGVPEPSALGPCVLLVGLLFRRRATALTRMHRGQRWSGRQP